MKNNTQINFNIKPKICVSVAESSLLLTKKSAKRAIDDGADLVELRLDFLSSIEPIRIKKEFEKISEKIILTVRRKDEGGKFRESEAKRIELIEQLEDVNNSLVDIELRTILENKKKINQKKNTIVSWHDFNKTPRSNKLEKLTELSSRYGKYVKIVSTAQTLQDNRRIIELYTKQRKGKLIAFCMGDKGSISRIISPLVGAPIVFAYHKKKIAPGQLSLNELKILYGEE